MDSSSRTTAEGQGLTHTRKTRESPRVRIRVPKQGVGAGFVPGRGVRAPEDRGS